MGSEEQFNRENQRDLQDYDDQIPFISDFYSLQIPLLLNMAST